MDIKGIREIVDDGFDDGQVGVAFDVEFILKVESWETRIVGFLVRGNGRGVLLCWDSCLKTARLRSYW